MKLLSGLKIQCLSLLLFFSFSLCASPSRPNIILIVSDNQSQALIGSYGNQHIKTPNIDALARNGVQFNMAFAVNGVCSPTRATLMTGLMPSQTGIHVALPSDINVPGWSGIEEFRSLPQTLFEAGYHTALVGKYHLGMPQQAQIGFQHWVTFPSGHTTTFYDQTVIDNGRSYKVEKHLTDFWTDKAVEYLRQQDNEKPFFLYLAYNGPYNLPPTVTMKPRNRHAAYYTENIPPMPQESIHPYLKNWAQGGRGPSNFMVKEGTTAWTAIEALNNKTAMINMASETAMVDDGVGMLIQTLKDLGLDKNTLVIYTSDQGATYGHNGLFGNTSWSFPFTVQNQNMQIPLIASHTGVLPAGLQSDSIINQFDIFPTLLDYVGLGDKKISNSPGRSFKPLMLGEDIEDWSDAAFFEFVTVRVIRTTRWKYMKRLDDEEPNTLFDMLRDPGEKHNLVNDPNFAQIRNALDARLDKFFSQYSDKKYNVWEGGSAKGILLEKYYGRDDIFSSRFPGWKAPTMQKAMSVFSDLK